MLVNILIIFFTLLIIYQLYSFKEGFYDSTSQYKPYNLNDPNNALILAQQNAGNIQVLKSQLDKLNGMVQNVTDLSNNYFQLEEQVQSLIKQQADYANQLNGGSDEPVNVSGTDTSYSDNFT